MITLKINILNLNAGPNIISWQMINLLTAGPINSTTYHLFLKSAKPSPNQ
jgi:hypothetical protein